MRSECATFDLPPCLLSWHRRAPTFHADAISGLLTFLGTVFSLGICNDAAAMSHFLIHLAIPPLAWYSLPLEHAVHSFSDIITRGISPNGSIQPSSHPALPTWASRSGWTFERICASVVLDNSFNVVTFSGRLPSCHHDFYPDAVHAAISAAKGGNSRHVDDEKFVVTVEIMGLTLLSSIYPHDHGHGGNMPTLHLLF